MMRRVLVLAFASLSGIALGVPGVCAEPAPQPQDPIAELLAGARASAPAPVAQPMVIGARIGEQPDRTRFVVEFSDPVAVRVFTLANPNRVVIDMPSVNWHLQGPPHPSGHGAVRSYRYGLFRPGNSRFVIDLNSPVSVARPVVLPPAGGNGYRVV